MTACRFRLPLLGAALVLAAHVSAADPPADPLPKGAKARLGTPRMRDTSSWSGASLTPDGRYLVGYTPKGFAKFDVTTGDQVGLVGPKSGAGFVGGRVEITADGKRGLTVTYAGVNVWEAASGKPLAKIDRRLPYGDYGAAVSADGSVLAVGGSRDIQSKDKPVTAVVWDVEKNEKRAEVTVLQNESANVALSPDGKTLATWGGHYEPTPPKDGPDPAADPSKIIQFWDATTGKELARARSDGYGPPAVVFSPDGQTAAVGHTGGSIRLVDPKTGAEKRRLFGRGDQGPRLAFSPDGKILTTAGTDGTTQLWGTADGARLGVVESPAGQLSTGVRGVRFTAPDRAVAWATIGFTAVVWELPSGKLLSPLGGHVGGVRSVAFAAGGKEILSGGEDGLLLRWDAAAGKEVGEIRLRGPGGFGPSGRFAMGAVQIAADGKTAVADRGGQGVYDLATGLQVAAPLTGLNFDVRPYLCADARTLLLVPGIPFPPKPQPKALRVPVWDVSTGAKLVDIETPVADLLAAAVTPDRSKLITALTTRPADGKAEFVVAGWDLKTGKKLGEVVHPGGFGTVYLAPAPDNTSALVATPEGKLLAVDVVAGKVTKEIDTERLRLSAVPVFGPGGKQFVLGFGAGFGPATTATIRVYDWESGKPTGAFFHGHTAAATCLAFSPDGKTLATGGHDTTILLWDIEEK
ncbi:MAG: (Myosin heavy-chain) kinase [Gemmataceae bacterium]|nr:(Myosin heavy-chain) kinase [Gemmataceae bacterium]